MEVRTRIPINVTLDPDLIRAMDAWLEQQPYKLSRASFIEAAIKRQLADEKGKKAKR